MLNEKSKYFNFSFDIRYISKYVFFQYLEFFYGNRDIKPSIVLCNWYLEVCIGPK